MPIPAAKPATPKEACGGTITINAAISSKPGTHYSYDERGNLKERLHNGKKSHFTWDLNDRLTGYEDDRLTVNFAYDAPGRRLFKLSKAK